jgi:hypothetical protein
MTTSPIQATPPGNVYAEIAVALSGTDAVNQKQRAQNDKDARIEQSIVNEVQEIIDSNKDYSVALAQVKKFLGNMQKAASNWGPEVQNWIQEELDKANSYTGPSQDLLKKLQKDEDKLSHDLQGLQNAESHLNDNENALSKLEDKLHNLQTQMKYYEDRIKSAPFDKQIEYAFKIAGLGIEILTIEGAISPYEYARNSNQQTVNGEKGTVDYDQSQINEDNATIKRDPAIRSTLGNVAERASATDTHLNQIITKDEATNKQVNAFAKQIAEIKFGKVDKS